MHSRITRKILPNQYVNYCDYFESRRGYDLLTPILEKEKDKQSMQSLS